MHQRNRPGTVNYWGEGLGIGAWVGLKLVLLDRNLALNSDATQNYRYVFDPLRVISETSRLNTSNQTGMKQSRGLNGNLKPVQKKTRFDQNGPGHRQQ